MIIAKSKLLACREEYIDVTVLRTLIMPVQALAEIINVASLQVVEEMAT